MRLLVDLPANLIHLRDRVLVQNVGKVVDVAGRLELGNGFSLRRQNQQQCSSDTPPPFGIRTHREKLYRTVWRRRADLQESSHFHDRARHLKVAEKLREHHEDTNLGDNNPGKANRGKANRGRGGSTRGAFDLSQDRLDQHYLLSASSFIFLHTSLVCPVLESITVVPGTQLQVTVFAFSCFVTTQCSMTSALA